jgi:hypothetical protein
MEETEFWKKTLDLQMRFCSLLVHNSSEEATGLARKIRKFPLRPKLEALTVF